MNSYQKGIKGEYRVVLYLEEKGYEILERRFRSESGEIDIIVRKNEEIVFVEVKSWNTLGMESLEHSVDTHKRERIKETALFYLNSHPELSDCHIRFDLVFLSQKMGTLDHWEHAF